MTACRGWWALFLLAAAPLGAIEVSTGFLIGASYDPRAFYVREAAGETWRKINSGPEYRKTAQGKLMGVALGHGGELEAALRPGVNFISIPMQGRAFTAFDPRGGLRPGFAAALSGKLAAADAAGLVVELVLFHPARDEEFFSTEAIVEAARNVAGWLIAENRRNVILNFAGDWTAPGWDFGSWIPLHFEELAEAVRARFQAERAGYTAPVALTAPVRLPEDAPLIRAADLLLLSGEALALDPRKIERPAVAVGAEACPQGFARLSGCVLAGAGEAADAAQALLAKPRAR